MFDRLSPPRVHPRPRRRLQFTATAVAAATIACAVLTHAAAPADSDDQDIQVTRSALEQWVETKRLISQERRDWKQGRELLVEQKDLIRTEIDALREKIAASTRNIAKTDEDMQTLEAKKASLEAVSASLLDTVVALETRTRALMNQLPAPIVDRVKPLTQRIPEDPANTTQSLGERFATVAGILKDISRFNSEITVTSEVRDLGDGTSFEVTAMYVGISYGFYVNAAGDSAGIGFGGPEGWVWTPRNDAAPEIARAIAILGGDEIADFVQVPVEIQQDDTP